MDGPTNVHPYSPSPWKGVPAAVMSESMRKIFHQRLLEVDCWLGVCYIRTRTGGGLLPRMHRTNWKFMRFPCPPGGMTEEADASWQQGFHLRERRSNVVRSWNRCCTAATTTSHRSSIGQEDISTLKEQWEETAWNYIPSCHMCCVTVILIAFSFWG